jgi:hypothetical protein
MAVVTGLMLEANFYCGQAHPFGGGKRETERVSSVWASIGENIHSYVNVQVHI